MQKALSGPKLWGYYALKLIGGVLAIPTVAWYVWREKEYPWWMVTPDDPVSPFGSGTTPGASVEPTQMKLYEKYGKKVGDFVWLAWRNELMGLSYRMKPDWLKDPKIRYMDLECWREGDNVIKLRQPDGSLLRERKVPLIPFLLWAIVGHRLSAVMEGKEEDEQRVRDGLEPIGRPAGRHPNMDARPCFTLRGPKTIK